MSYTKSSSSVVRLTRIWSHYLYGRSPVFQSGVRDAGSRTVSESRTGAPVSQWRDRIRRHVNAAGGMSASRSGYNGGFGMDYGSFYAYSNYQYILNYETETGRLLWVPYPTAAGFSSKADNEARTRLLKDAADAMTAFRSLTAIGELRETLRMLRSPAKSLFQGIRDHIGVVTKRTRRIKNKQTKKRIIRESYLEATFGWSPLINDIKGAGNALNQRLERYQGNYTRVTGKGRDTTHTYTPMVSYNQGGIILQRRWGVNTTTTHSKWYRGEVRSVCPNPVLADMRLFGVTWGDLVLTGWELVPYSFVVDYFTNIGDILEAWTIRDSDWAWLFSTDKYFARNTSANVVLENWDITGYSRYRAEKGYTRVFTCSPARAYVSSVNRSTPLSGPTPSFRFEIPGVGSRKWLNLAALAGQHNRAVRYVST